MKGWTALLLLLGAGCGTYGNLSGNNHRLPGASIYGGIRTNALEMDHNTAHHPSILCFLCADMPFSFVFDTILLPFTIPKAIFSSGASAPELPPLQQFRRKLEEARTISMTFQLEKEAADGRGAVVNGSLMLQRGNKVRLEMQVFQGEVETRVRMVSDGKKIRVDAGSNPPIIVDAPQALEEWYRAVFFEVGILENRWLPPGNPLELARGGKIATTLRQEGPLLYSSSSSSIQIIDRDDGVRTDVRKVTLDSPPLRFELRRTYDLTKGIFLGREIRMSADNLLTRETYREFRIDEEIPEDRFRLPE